MLFKKNNLKNIVILKVLCCFLSLFLFFKFVDAIFLLNVLLLLISNLFTAIFYFIFLT
jgi:hypothetical protein